MRTLYLRDDAAAGMPGACRVLPVSPLLRELIVRATELPVHYDERGAAGHVVALILDELHHERSLPLHLPMPRDKRLRGLCLALLEQPGDPRTLDEWAPSTNASPRTLARLFVAETGLTFGAWRQQARVLEAMGRLGGGQAVTDVALDLGYDSVSAFSAMFRRAAGVSPSAYRPSRWRRSSPRASFQPPVGPTTSPPLSAHRQLRVGCSSASRGVRGYGQRRSRLPASSSNGRARIGLMRCQSSSGGKPCATLQFNRNAAVETPHDFGLFCPAAFSRAGYTYA